MIKEFELYFLGKYDNASIVLKLKSKTCLYFVFVTCAVLILATIIMLSLRSYEIMSIEFFSRASLIFLGIIGLIFLRIGRYYIAVNLFTIGATAALALPMFLVKHETELSLFISMVLLYVFIIVAALLGTRGTVIATGLLVIMLGTGAVVMSDVVSANSARKIIGTYAIIAIFITVLCYLILKNMVSAMRKISDEMKKGVEKSDIIIRLLNNARSLSETLALSSTQLADTSSQFSENAQNQASAVEEITSSMEEMASGIDNISENSDSQSETMSFLMEKMSQFTSTILEVKNSVEIIHGRIQKITGFAQSGNEKLELMKQSMNNIGSSSGEITGIINIINDISDQINLLSLNAAIEAARAGEAGRGFAVVADEISKLADKTSRSVKNIGQLIAANENEINTGNAHVSETVETIQSITRGVSDNFEAIREISLSMEKQLKANDLINKDTETVKNKSEEIKSAAREHKIATDEITKTIFSINKLTMDNSSGAEEILASTEKLSGITDSLKELIMSIDGSEV